MAALRHTVTLEPVPRAWLEPVVRARGRGWFRLPAAAAAVVGGGVLRRAYRRGPEEFAEQWNQGVPAAVARTPEQIRAAILQGPAEGPGRSGRGLNSRSLQGLAR